MTGNISGMTLYTRCDSDKIIVRSKGGVSREKLKKLPQYESIRNHQKEWSGVTKFSSGLRYSLGGLHRLADFNILPAFNSIINKCVKSEDINLKGKRPVCISTRNYLLEGFSLNRKFVLNNILRVYVNFDIDRNTLRGSVVFPSINTTTDLLNVKKLPFFRLLLSIGTVSDMFFDELINDYLPLNEALHGASDVFSSQWYSANTVIESQTLTVQMNATKQLLLTDDVSVIMCLGVEFGGVGFTGEPEPVKYSGSGKIVVVC